MRFKTVCALDFWPIATPPAVWHLAPIIIFVRASNCLINERQTLFLNPSRLHSTPYSYIYTATRITTKSPYGLGSTLHIHRFAMHCELFANSCTYMLYSYIYIYI